ncbi:MAG: hypothetical protein K2G28_10680 [Acetatifactor sp.]|nr:hypothetical protein [Acetatifactor sp.]MDE7352014.1 hypothetical protein [Acetatifactor sp.]
MEEEERRGESGERYVLRFYETRGGRGEARIRFHAFEVQSVLIKPVRKADLEKGGIK